MKEVGQHRRDHAGLVHQRLGLKALDIGEREVLLGGVEQPAIRPFERVGAARDAQRVRLQQQGEAGQRALLDRRRRQAAERRPHGVLDLRGHDDLFMGEQGSNPLRCPAPLGRVVDPAQRLKRERLAAIGAESQRMMRAAHRQNGGARRESLVEDIDLAVRVTAELERDQREQHRLARAGRADHQHVTDIADMGGEAKRRRSGGAGVEQRRAVEMLVAHRTRPDGRQRHQMREVQRVDERLPDVGVGLARQRRQPCLDRIYALADGRETQPLDDALELPDLLVDPASIAVGNRDGRRQIAERDVIAAEHLQGQVGVDHLVVGVAVEQLGRLIIHDLAHERDDRLALVEPLPAQLGQRLGCVALVERDEARDPAIGVILLVERVEDARPAHVREAEHGQRPQVRLAQPRLQPAGQRRVGKQRVQVDRSFRHRDPMRR